MTMTVRMTSPGTSRRARRGVRDSSARAERIIVKLSVPATIGVVKLYKV
jgi:hypothetical protein